MLKKFSGDALEIKLNIQPNTAKKYGINVYCDKNGENGFPIIFEMDSSLFMMGTTQVPFELKNNEPLELHMFLDKNIIEVFVNDRQAALSVHKYVQENINVALFSEGGDILVKEVIGWDMKPIYDKADQPEYEKK